MSSVVYKVMYQRAKWRISLLKFVGNYKKRCKSSRCFVLYAATRLNHLLFTSKEMFNQSLRIHTYLRFVYIFPTRLYNLKSDPYIPWLVLHHIISFAKHFQSLKGCVPLPLTTFTSDTHDYFYSCYPSISDTNLNQINLQLMFALTPIKLLSWSRCHAFLDTSTR